MIKSLQGLRTIGMLIIFMYHSGAIFDGHLAVTFFFILSGFVMYYNYTNKDIKLTLKDSFEFTKNKMISLYIVHLFTFLLAAIIFYKDIINNFTFNLIRAIPNLLLLQSFIPNASFYFSFNNASWYLSVTLLCYLCTNLFIKLWNRIRQKEYLSFLVILSIYSLKTFFVITVESLPNEIWLVYINPVLRLFDYFIGMGIATVFIRRKNEDKKVNGNLEFISVIILFLAWVFARNISTIYRFSIYYMPFIMLIIYVFAFEEGYLSKILSNKYILLLASISFEFYMVHELILRFLRRILDPLPILVCKVLQISIGFGVSLVLAYLINKFITRRYKKTKFILGLK